MSTDKKEYGISVIIPCYNVGQYVEETLKSVLNQSFKDYEIICLNDGSTDGTLEILNKYQSLYPYIQVFLKCLPFLYLLPNETNLLFLSL